MRLLARVERATGATQHYRAHLEGGEVCKDEELPTPASVEIRPAENAFLLLYLDGHGKCLTDTWHQTLEQAKAQARHDRGDRILRTRAHLVLGTEHQLDRALSRSEDSRKPNTAYIEPLNLFLRRCCSYLQRRTPGAARNPRRLDDALQILRVYYNFIRPHSSLRFGKITRTPAMQAGTFDRPLTFREVFSWVAPPPRPLPSMVEFR